MRLPLLVLHVSAGVLAMLAGALAIGFPKGSQGHRLAGNVFVICMLTVSAVGAYLGFMKSEAGLSRVVTGVEHTFDTSTFAFGIASFLAYPSSVHEDARKDRMGCASFGIVDARTLRKIDKRPARPCTSPLGAPERRSRKLTCQSDRHARRWQHGRSLQGSRRQTRPECRDQNIARPSTASRNLVI
jgi:hypothetical protein